MSTNTIDEEKAPPPEPAFRSRRADSRLHRKHRRSPIYAASHPPGRVRIYRGPPQTLRNLERKVGKPYFWEATTSKFELMLRSC
jgi:hypothetical protein